MMCGRGFCSGAGSVHSANHCSRRSVKPGTALDWGDSSPAGNLVSALSACAASGPHIVARMARTIWLSRTVQ
jgi:hypothetical protein